LIVLLQSTRQVMDVTELFFFGGIAEKAADLSDTRYQGTGILKLIPGIRQEYFVFKNTLVGAKYFCLVG